MSASNWDVIIVGAGAAGLAAAIGLARQGCAVVVVEAAAFPGAENWSGCVYFAENLADERLLGKEGVEALAWERRLIERGAFATDGHGLLGMTYRDPDAFRHCYTVLRPIYDHHLAQVAIQYGAALLTQTTAESLIRDRGRVIGICTNRGPLYANLTFLAEGDASHLVTREGYEHSTNPGDAPKFLQGIKEVIELPPRAIEQRFGVGSEEGVAYEMLVRNGTLRGKPVHLNLGGFLYTNRQSLSIGLVLPADNLGEHFEGDPNLLLEWFEHLPALRPWLADGKRGAFGAKLIRGGGAKDIPTLIDDGLAIGGAASAIGIDFPYPNFTGPATAMGLLLSEAVRKIRAAGGRFDREELRRHYLEPLQKTHYWQDVEFLRRWPGYVKQTQFFFGRNLDLSLGSAYVLTRSDRGTRQRWTDWLRLMQGLAGGEQLPALQQDAAQLSQALHLTEVVRTPGWGRLLLDGTLNAFRDLFRQPRANLPPTGTVKLHYSIAGGAEPSGLPPAQLRRWFQRYAPALAAAARTVYSNDDIPLTVKLPRAVNLMTRQVNLFDLFRLVGLGLGLGLLRWLERRRGAAPITAPGSFYGDYARAASAAMDLTSAIEPAAQLWEARLAQLSYDTARQSHIHVLWPEALENEKDIVRAGLFHVCPAHVYEARVSPTGQLQVVVNFENCIKCETCWRTSDLVDWGRDGKQRFVYAVYSPVVNRLIAAQDDAGLAVAQPPRDLDLWQQELEELTDHDGGKDGLSHASGLAGAVALVGRLERKLVDFDEELAREPRTMDRARAEWLQLLARHAQQQAAQLVELVHTFELKSEAVRDRLVDLANGTLIRAERRTGAAARQRFSWAAADGRQLRQHHLRGLRCYLDWLTMLRPDTEDISPPPDELHRWLTVPTPEDHQWLTQLQQRLDALFPAGVWRDLEQQKPLTKDQDKLLRQLLSEVPPPRSDHLARSLHPWRRKALLAELGRRDPSLGYRVASHLWARDVALLQPDAAIAATGQRWARGEEWACFTQLTATMTGQEALLVPARLADRLLILTGDRLLLAPVDGDGVFVGPQATLGLRGAGLAYLTLHDESALDAEVRTDPELVQRLWTVVSSADLIAIAYGMADLLCQRSIAHATNRVQFPGLFHDEEARDAIGKFGAVKKMIADMAAGRYLLETLDLAISPADFDDATAGRMRLLKAVSAEVLGTAPGSVSYNAGQVFGGTGYSEDDILSKYYRDAAAWRFLGADNVTTFQEHGNGLLEHWQGGEQLSVLADEASLFDQVVQRQTLQAELNALRQSSVRLRSLVGEWLAGVGGTTANGRATAPVPAQEVDTAEMCAALGRQDGLLLAGKALLVGTFARLELGGDSAAELALLRVWLELLATAQGDFEGTVRRHLNSRDQTVQHVQITDGIAAITRHEDLLKSANPYDSGDFLTKPVNLQQPRLVPDLIEIDPALRQRHEELRTLFIQQFGRPRNGMPYERYLEEQHRPDAADLEFLRRHGFFRIPIPKELGGEGRGKVDYYLLTTTAHRLADGAISLTIQVNSSLGTTPVLLPREKDLPKAQKDVAAFVGDTAMQQEVRTALQQLAQQTESGSVAAAQAPQKKLEESVFAKPALRVLCHHFTQAWQEVGRVRQSENRAGLLAALREALMGWELACRRGPDFLLELGRRLEAATLFLRWVASGQISGFALTEPSAGSDTARVATRARLRSVPVEGGAEGVYTFVPVGGKEIRTLLDAQRLEFREDADSEYRAFYRWTDTADPAPIGFDEYDYETDDPNKLRYFERRGQRVQFHDIGRVREREGRQWYDYWELTGAKMWITNGRICGILCLYAKTEEGVTGFIVDRHAEGLVVGKDEAKMGQSGSPTNELALQAVRVPLENVIGLEGRGQVNALETLNVGRAGLAMSAMSQMSRLLEFCQGVLRDRYRAVPDWAAWRLRQMEEERFIAEALSWEIIGRFEHKQTKSVRIESAAAKMLVSELYHKAIETAEEIHGSAGQTQLHLVEKRKRDARVLNIYEGTNEVQRFLILRDLVGDLAGRWQEAAAPAGLTPEVQTLESLKADLRQRTETALKIFGQQLWQNPNLQASCFLLSEAVAWLAAQDSTLGRLTWLGRRVALDTTLGPLLETGRRALMRCALEVRSRLKRFDSQLALLRRGVYDPTVRAASLLFLDASASAAEMVPAPNTIDRPLSILVVIEPPEAGAPQPHVADGQLLEAYRVLTEADRAALETALRLRDHGRAGARVTVQLATVAPRAAVPLLREALSLGVDRVHLVPAPTAALPPDQAAAALAAVLSKQPAFDLILMGGDSQGEEGVLGRLTAAALGRDFGGRAAQVAVQADASQAVALLVSADGRHRRQRGLPVALAVEPGWVLRSFTTLGYQENQSHQIEIHPWPEQIHAAAVVFEQESQTGTTATVEKLPQALLPHEAGHLLLETLGVHTVPGAQVNGSASLAIAAPVPEVAEPAFARNSAAVVAVLAADATGHLQPTAQRVLEAAHFVSAFAVGPVVKTALVLAGGTQATQQQVVAQLAKLWPFDICLVPVDAVEASEEMRGRILAEAWSGLEAHPAAVIGEPWTEDALARLSVGNGDCAALRVRALNRQEGQFVAETIRQRGKYRARRPLTLTGGRTCWISLASETDIGAASPPVAPPTRRIERWAPRLDRFFGKADIRRLLEELQQDTGLVRLTDADFIIDVGFGVANRDGYEEVIEPLEQALRNLGVRGLMIGGSRKVTEELHLLPLDRQIGQSGVSVNPTILLAIGVSGAPQHLNYIGPRATVLAFNRDPDAPLMTLNQRQPRPRVYPVVGDLFETVPAFLAALAAEAPGVAVARGG